MSARDAGGLPRHARGPGCNLGPMGQRLTRIYTRTGDDGTTGLGDGSRVAKDALRVEVMG